MFCVYGQYLITLKCTGLFKQVLPKLAMNEPGKFCGAKRPWMCLHTLCDFEYTCIFPDFCDLIVTATREKPLPFAPSADWEIFAGKTSAVKMNLNKC